MILQVLSSLRAKPDKISSLYQSSIFGLIAGNDSLISKCYISVGCSSHQWCLS